MANGDTPKLWARAEAQVIAAVLVLGGGGFTSHSALGGKIDRAADSADKLEKKIDGHSEKLEWIKGAVVEVKAHSIANEKATERTNAELTQQRALVSSLETHLARVDEKLVDLERRVSEASHK